MAKLTAKQERFCQEYLKDFNATKAAERAGYSKKTAASIGNENLRKPQIQTRISGKQSARAKRLDISKDRVVQEIAKIAFADIGLVCEWNEEGKLTLIEKSEMDPQGIAALQSIESIDSYDKDGNILSTKNKFRLHDKIKALELLSKHLGLLDGQGSGSNNKGDVAGSIRDIIGRIGIGSKAR